MGVDTVVEVTSASGIVGVVGQQQQQPPPPQQPQHRHPGSLMTGSAAMAGAAADEKGADHWGKNMQRWRNDNIDIAKGSLSLFFYANSAPKPQRCGGVFHPRAALSPARIDAMMMMCSSSSSSMQ